MQPPEIQKAILDSDREAFEAYDRELYLKVSAQAADQMKAKGVTITEPDHEAFRKMVLVVWKEFGEKVPAAVPISRRSRRQSNQPAAPALSVTHWPRG